MLLIGQVADGMAYLEEFRVVHLSLDLGGIQLKSPQHAIICNFELSVKLPSNQDCVDLSIYEYINIDLKIHSESAASECILFNKANSKSDVWSFGIILWKMFTRKRKDETDNEFYSAIRNGNVPIKPSDFPDLLFDLMSACLQLNATDRPTFEKIKNTCQATTKAIDEICNDIQSHLTPEPLNSKFHLLDYSNLRLQNEKIYNGHFGSVLTSVYTSLDSIERIVALKTVDNPEDNFKASKVFVHAIHMMSLFTS